MSIRVFHCYLFIAVYLVLTTGCTDTSSLTSTDDLPIPTAPASDSTSKAAAEPPTDKSLTLEEYIQLGVPAHDRIWSGNDMVQAAKTLVKIAQKGAGHLPRYQSEKSGEMFERLTADDNLDMSRNPSTPMDLRFPDTLNYMQSINQIFKLYLAAFNQHKVGDSELVELTGAILRVSVVMIKVINEFVPTLDSNDPTYPVRMDALKRIKNSMALVVTGNLQILSESHTYRPSELKRLLGYMQNTYPDILPMLPKDSRSKVLVRLRSFLSDPKMQYLKPELTTFVTTVENSSQPDKTP